MDRESDIKNGITTLREGGTIIYPTDTIWGLGCDATLGSAVERILSIKNRDSAKSLMESDYSPNYAGYSFWFSFITDAFA